MSATSYGWPISMCLVLLQSAWLCVSVVIHSVPFSLPPPPAMTGGLSPNSILYDAERLQDKRIPAPRSYAILRDQVFTITADNLVVNVGGCHPVVLADLKPRGCRGVVRCGSLTSIRTGPQGMLLVVDAYRGLFQIHPTSGVVHFLFNSSTLVNNRPSVYLNDAAILPDGTILVSDSSPTFGLKDEFWIRFEGRADGRLIAVHPANGNATEVMAGLAYPNGVELTFDNNSVLVSETGRARIIKVDLSKKNLYRRSVFSDNLPGMPENIRKSDKGSYLVGMAYPRFAGSLSPMDEYSLHPSSRDILAVHQSKEQLQRMMSRRGLAVELNEMGDVIGSLHDNTGSRISHVTEVVANDGVMYVGTRDQNAIIRVVLPDGPYHRKSSETKLKLLFTRCRISETQYRLAKEKLKNRRSMNVPRSKPNQYTRKHGTRLNSQDENGQQTVHMHTYYPMMHRGQQQYTQRTSTRQHHTSPKRERTYQTDNSHDELSPWIIPPELSGRYRSDPSFNYKSHVDFTTSKINQKPQRPVPFRPLRERERNKPLLSVNQPRQLIGNALKGVSHAQNQANSRWRPTVSQNLLRENGHHHHNLNTISQHRRGEMLPDVSFYLSEQVQNAGLVHPYRLTKSHRDKTSHGQNATTPQHDPLLNGQHMDPHRHHFASREKYDSRSFDQKTPASYQPGTRPNLESNPSENPKTSPQSSTVLSDPSAKIQKPGFDSGPALTTTPIRSSENQQKDSARHTTPLPVASYSTVTNSSPNGRYNSKNTNPIPSLNPIPIEVNSNSTQTLNEQGQITLPLFSFNASVTPITVPTTLGENLISPTTNLPHLHQEKYKSSHGNISVQTSKSINDNTHESLPNKTVVADIGNHVTITIDYQRNYSNLTSTNPPIAKQSQNNSKVSMTKRISSTENGSKSSSNQILLESPGHENRNLTKRQTTTQAIRDDSLFSLLKTRRHPPHLETTGDQKASSRTLYNAMTPSPNKAAPHPERPTNPTMDPGRLIVLQRRLGQLKSQIQRVKPPARGPAPLSVDQPQLQRIRNMIRTINSRRPESSPQLQARRRNVTLIRSRQLYRLVPDVKEANPSQLLLRRRNPVAKNLTPAQTVSGAARSPLYRRLATVSSNAVRKIQSMRSRTPSTSAKSNDNRKYIEVISGTGRVFRMPVHPRLLQRILLKRLENTLKSSNKQ